MRFDVEFGGVAPLNAELEISPQALSADMGTVVQIGSKVEIDPVPTEGSENAVSSGGVFEALKNRPTADEVSEIFAQKLAELDATEVAY